MPFGWRKTEEAPQLIILLATSATLVFYGFFLRGSYNQQTLFLLHSQKQSCNPTLTYNNYHHLPFKFCNFDIQKIATLTNNNHQAHAQQFASQIKDRNNMGWRGKRDDDKIDTQEEFEFLS